MLELTKRRELIQWFWNAKRRRGKREGLEQRSQDFIQGQHLNNSSPFMLRCLSSAQKRPKKVDVHGRAESRLP